MQRLELLYRNTTPEDVKSAAKWLEGWKLPPIEEGMYPETGLMMYDCISGNPIYMGFVWCSNSKLAQLGFVSRNPFFKTKLPQGTRKDFLFQLIRYAKTLGYDYVISWAANDGLVKDFKEIGLQETSDRCSELIQKLY